MPQLHTQGSPHHVGETTIYCPCHRWGSQTENSYTIKWVWPPLSPDHIPFPVKPLYTLQQWGPQQHWPSPANHRPALIKPHEEQKPQPRSQPSDMKDPERWCLMLNTDQKHLGHFKYYRGCTCPPPHLKGIYGGGTKDVSAKCLSDLIRSWDWVPPRRGKINTPPIVFSFSALLKYYWQKLYIVRCTMWSFEIHIHWNNDYNCHNCDIYTEIHIYTEIIITIITSQLPFCVYVCSENT